ncbi:hypothetical protein OQY15_21970 [Pedobacter sp. MC2016-15]|uniref:hypothetical protein n=1 Tax=Pedobacter sp. MC2016-15 TaxID=2994473 RepID=UPI002246BCF7|nr:hypothetical protein [Pedobacter sp. MC2016-15]MCX2481782.1 hypothetical protein [Pedobacter sp. MC2016-15]
MRRFEITIQGYTYHITELNQRSGLYEVSCNGVSHTIGKSCKTDDWLYIRTSPFSPTLPLEILTSLLESKISKDSPQKLIA